MSPKCEFKGCGLEKKALRLLGIPIYWACPREADAHALCAKLAESEAKVRELEAKLAEAAKPCEWVYDPRGGYTVYCVSGSWSPVLLPFCPGCGHPVVVKEEASRKKGAEHESTPPSL